jgi:glucan phosphorylase
MKFIITEQQLGFIFDATWDKTDAEYQKMADEHEYYQELDTKVKSGQYKKLPDSKIQEWENKANNIYDLLTKKYSKNERQRIFCMLGKIKKEKIATDKQIDKLDNILGTKPINADLF